MKDTLFEQLKWETAIELGLGSKVIHKGWANLTAEETGKIGGIVSKKIRRYQKIFNELSQKI